MNIKEFYAQIGGDYNDVFSRLQSETIIMKFVKKFESDKSVADLKQARENDDIKAAFLAAHTLKGVAGTLGMKELANSVSALTELLRPLKEFPAEEHFCRVYSAYDKITELIPKLDA